MVDCCICGPKAVGRYRCSKCPERYCSADCCKEHQKACTRASEKKEAEKVLEEPSEATLMRPKRPRDGESVEILSEYHIDVLRNDPKVRDHLRTRELREMIRTIDASRSRLDALETALHNSKEFNEFCRHLLRVIHGK